MDAASDSVQGEYVNAGQENEEWVEKCMSCKHVYRRKDDADTLYCICCKGCRYEKYTDEGCPEAYAPSGDDAEWIPVSERLPSEKGEYLVTYRLVLYGDVLDSEDKVGLDTFRGKASWAKKENRRVVAWKPKPKPYHKDFEDIELRS